MQRADAKQRALLAYRRAYFAPGQGTPAWSLRMERIRERLNRLGVSIQDRNNALWRGPLRRNPQQDEKLSPAARTAFWVGSVATIVGGAAVLITYLWPMPTEHLFFKGVMFAIDKSGSTWTSSFAYGSQSFSVNGTSRDDVVARTHDQIDALVTAKTG